MLMTYVSGDTTRAERVLHPFRHTIKPIFDQSALLPDLYTVSRAGETNIEGTPRRLSMQGAIISDIWPDTALEVWVRWWKFTEN